jgi:hypothetical protein
MCKFPSLVVSMASGGVVKGWGEEPTAAAAVAAGHWCRHFIERVDPWRCGGGGGGRVFALPGWIGVPVIEHCHIRQQDVRQVFVNGQRLVLFFFITHTVTVTITVTCINLSLPQTVIAPRLTPVCRISIDVTSHLKLIV